MRVFNHCMICSTGILGLIILISPVNAQEGEIQLEEARPPVIGTIVVPEEEQAQSDDNPFGPDSGEADSTKDKTSESQVSPRIRPVRKKVEDALRETTAVEMFDVPLRDVVEYFSSLHEIPILLDQKELDNEGISQDHELTLTVTGVELQDALTLLLETAELGFIVKNNVLVVMPKYVADEYYETRVYDVRDLYIDDPEALADVLIHTTGDNSWKEQGGSGDLSFIHSSFVIRQNRATHREIDRLLVKLRENLKGLDDLPGWPRKERNEGDSQAPQGSGFGSGFGGGGASAGGGGGGGFF
ncbi:hypothetical protein AB1L42_21180 [Thalassoglobus sp. JC818]|uniref:hypothetical protein n=1 Tax=Thalassoglobus sp. JC818 TaxID=3232136 RepID=UPI0034581534